MKMKEKIMLNIISSYKSGNLTLNIKLDVDNL